ncbi:MAG: methionyl-tRNA formyltransferase [Clostridiales bacterium]|nr:methionyl-tRNA formyltransferase [Clostridiales bacterium]
MKVLFCGTPDFAIPSLNAILEADYDVVAVITQPDRKRGRGHKMTPCAVKEFALEKGLIVHSFDRIRNKENVEFLRNLDFDVMVTAAYGQILSQRILDIPLHGCINVHGSLLPKYRGPAPIQWVIINGEDKTGITTMLTERGVDCGDILLQKETEILPDEAAGELFERLSVMGGEVLVETLNSLTEGTLTPTPQDHDNATHFPMLKKEDGKIDFHKSAKEIKDLIRGVNPWPGAYLTLGRDVLKVWRASIIDEKATSRPATIVSCDAKTGIIINTQDQQICLEEIQFAGKRRMDSKIALCGREIDSSQVID